MVYTIHRWRRDVSQRVWRCVPPEVPTVYTRASEDCQGCGVEITYRDLGLAGRSWKEGGEQHVLNEFAFQREHHGTAKA